MADIDSMNASTPTVARLGHITSVEAPETHHLLLEMKDHLLPRTAAQLLQGRASYGKDSLLNVASAEKSAEVVGNYSVPSQAPVTSIETQSFCASAAKSTETVTDNTSVNPCAGTVPLMTQNESAAARLSHLSAKEAQSNEVKSFESQSKTLTKSRISKEDFETVGSVSVFNNKLDEISSRIVKAVDISSSNCHSEIDDSSEDKERPFARVDMGKERLKKRRKKDSEEGKTGEKKSKCLLEYNVNSDDELQTSSRCSKANSVSHGNCDAADLVPQKDANSERKIAEKISCFHSLSSSAFMTSDTLGLKQVGKDNSHSGTITNDVYKDSGMVSEDISNISCSSAKENVQSETRNLPQKLPRTKRQHYHIDQHVNKIRNVFPPCFVVVESINTLPICYAMKKFSPVDSVLPLSVRVKQLSDLCRNGLISCRKRKKNIQITQVISTNMLEDTVMSRISDDEFETPRARSLRKRDKTISYIEPSEDDILDEFSKKHSRTRNPADKSENKGTTEIKKRKKCASSDANVAVSNKVLVSSAHTDGNKDKANIEKNKGKVILDQARTKTKDNQKWTPQEIIVYPRTGPNNKNSYHVISEGKNTLSSNTEEKSKQTVLSAEKVKIVSTVPSTSCSISVSNSTTSGTRPITVFPTAPVSLTGTPTTHLVTTATTSIPATTATGAPNPPQFSVMKMNGKDVLFMLANGVGVPLPVSLPRGKTLFVGSSYLTGQSVRHTVPISSSKQAGVTLPQATPLQSLLQVVNRPIQPNVQNVSLAPASNVPLAGLVSTAGIQPITLTSSSSSSQAALTGLSAPITVLTSTAAATRSVSSTTMSLQTLPPAVISVASSNTAAVVQNVCASAANVQTVVPNQADLFRSVRIFVPSGTVTAGNLVNSSPLTFVAANSQLLPQRKLQSDHHLTPEQRQAKRRKLEKKYPLPPGVVIKTEPLDTIPKTYSLAPRSLLTQNVRLLSTSRPSLGVQSIRIINSPLAGAFSLRNLRGNSNILYRTASLGVLVPAPLGHITSSVAASTTSATTTSTDTSCTSSTPLGHITSSVAASTTSATTTSTDTSCTNSTPLGHITSSVAASTTSATTTSTDTSFTSSTSLGHITSSVAASTTSATTTSTDTSCTSSTSLGHITSSVAASTTSATTTSTDTSCTSSTSLGHITSSVAASTTSVTTSTDTSCTSSTSQGHVTATTVTTTTTSVITTSSDTSCSSRTSLTTAMSPPPPQRVVNVPSPPLVTSESQLHDAEILTDVSTFDSDSTTGSVAACVTPTVTPVVTSCEPSVAAESQPCNTEATVPDVSNHASSSAADSQATTKSTVFPRVVPLATLCESTVPAGATDIPCSLSSPVSSADSRNPSCAAAVASGRKLSDSPALPVTSSSSCSSTEASARTDIQELSKFIQAQEARGLKGERLEKLKELLARKEEHYRKMLKQARVSTLTVTGSRALNGNAGDVSAADRPETNSAMDGQAGSETDPFVID